MRVRESEIYYRLFSFATNPRESDWSPNGIKKKQYWFVATYKANGFWPQSETSPNGVRTSPKSQIPTHRKNCAPVKTFRCCSIKMCPAGISFSHQHRKPNLKWISSLSDSDRLEIHLTFGFRCWRLKWFKRTTDFKKAAHEVNGTWSRVISTRSWDYIVCKPWRPLGGLLGRCRANHTLEESMGKGFFTLLRFLKTFLSHPSINAPKKISTEFLACQTLTG